MPFSARRPAALLFLACCASSLGCGNGFDARVSGVVTLDGAPVSTGTIYFDPRGPGMMATGEIGPGGSYSVSSNARRGLDPGEYDVMLNVRAATIFPDDGLPQPGKLLIPEKYTKTNTSGLNCTVQPGSNSFNIDLVSE